MAPKWYHWISLVVCVLFALGEGILDVIWGAGSGPFHKIDDIAVRFIGAGLVAFGLLIFMRKSWTFWGLISFFLLSILEVQMTCHFTSHGLERLFEILFIRVALCVFFGVPIVLLIWLQRVFAVPNQSPEPTPVGADSSASRTTL